MVDSATDTPGVRVALLALPESTASTLHGFFDLMSSVGRDWEILIEGRPPRPRMEPCIVSADGRYFKAGNGIGIQPDYSLDNCPEPEIICIADLFIAPDAPLEQRYAREIEWLRARFAAGATIATSCSAAMLLAATGLLNGYDATTHWGYCDALARRFPGVRVHPNRALVVSGEGRRLVMAGGGTSWLDLVLYLIARFVSAGEAMKVARINLIDWHEAGQLPFATMTTTHQREDALIADCQRWLAEHYNLHAPVAEMTRRSGLGERSFKRRFRMATGMSPLEYVHNLRIEEARQLLEADSMAVEMIALEVGYEDSSFFNRLFKRRVGMTPAQYRRRFRSLRSLLASG